MSIRNHAGHTSQDESAAAAGKRAGEPASQELLGPEGNVEPPPAGSGQECPDTFQSRLGTWKPSWMKTEARADWLGGRA